MSLLPTTTDYNLVLTGSIGPNQLIVARHVAARLNLPFVDADQEIERHAEMLPSQFKDLFGEARLRALESEVVRDLTLHRSTVIHMNGQMIAYGDHLARMRECSYILCLVAALDAVLARLHVALGARYHNPTERAYALGMLKRAWSIRGKQGVHEFDTTDMTEADMVNRIAELWAQRVIEFTRLG
ncbi:MAG: hypothetical protein IT320_14865 [Anaerolineae bacterium]|nr:hypothetical protein [Anaerolineae bacterium]